MDEMFFLTVLLNKQGYICSYLHNNEKTTFARTTGRLRVIWASEDWHRRFLVDRKDRPTLL